MTAILKIIARKSEMEFYWYSYLIQLAMLD